MNAVRMITLLGAALLTMGSGGIAKAPSNETAVVHTPETLDVEPSAAAEAVDQEREPRIATAASDNHVGEVAPVPPTAAEMAEQGPAIEVSLSDDYIQGRYYTGGGLLGFDEATGHVGAYFSDNRDFIGNVGLMSDRVPLFIPGLTLSVGARGYVALLSDPDDDVVGLAPGVEGRFGLPYDFPIALVGNVFYSPDILTLGDAENIIDIDARVEAEVIPDIVGFIGIREFRFDSDEGKDKKAANEIQVGARFNL
ncbi:MAG: YfaZ family outer membrane protein [Alphaproteobacteria bacterium]